MKTRIFAGCTAAGLTTLLVFRGPFFGIQLTVMVFAVLAYLEFDRLFFPTPSATRQVRLGAMLSAAIFVIQFNPALGWIFLWLPFVFFAARHVYRSNQAEADFQKSVRDLSIEVLGFTYVFSLFGFLIPIAGWGVHGRTYLFLLFCIVFGSDTAAYFVGSRFGKHKIAGKLSPKKSLEGAIGGLLGSLIMAAVCIQVFYRGEKTADFLARVFFFVPFGSVLSQLGDLFESLLKRSQAQKDSGSFLPGHGGILDRVDGFALSAPVYYAYLVMVVEPR